MFTRALRDECGGETLEYSLIAALIVIGAIMIMSKLGVKAVARWSSIEEVL
jgi:Flp pilus assembly pilin Flp